MLLTSDGYCYAREDSSHEFIASVVGTQFIDLYRKAKAASAAAATVLLMVCTCNCTE